MTPEPLWGSESFRRLVGWSAGLHLLLLVMMLFGGGPWSRSRADSVVFVDVIAAAVPAPAPAAPARKQVVDEAVVIPKKPRPLPKKKPPEKKVEAKPEPEPPTPSAQELLARMRERQAASTVLADIRSRHEGQEGQQGGGRVGRFDPLAARYIGQIKACMHSKFIWRDTTRRADLQVQFYLDIDEAGTVLAVQLAEGSGNRYLDESAERAIWKCRNFGPPPPQMPRQFKFVFVPWEHL